MRLFAIGDTHLPSTRGKTMDRFGWTGHPAPLAEAWDRTVTSEDAIIVAGDISWATKPAEVADDLAWLDARPGKKILLRGNHDYWWGDSAAKLRRLFEPYRSIAGFLQNNAATVGPYVVAGSRLWTTAEAPPMPAFEPAPAPEVAMPAPDVTPVETAPGHEMPPAHEVMAAPEPPPEEHHDFAPIEPPHTDDSNDQD